MIASIRSGSAFVAVVSLAMLGACEDKVELVNVVAITPTLTTISPAQGAVATTVGVALTGTDFIVGATTVSVSGEGVAVQNVNVASSTSMTADFVIAGTAALGARQVTVSTASGASNAQPFAVVATARFIDLGLVIRDTMTNLYWEKKTSASGLHHVDDTYTWCAATGNTAGACAGNTTSWIGSVNAENYAGFSDWRVPSETELRSIVVPPCPGSPAPCLDPIFSPTQGNLYKSATEVDPASARSVNLSSGIAIDDLKTSARFVRAVRSGS